MKEISKIAHLTTKHIHRNIIKKQTQQYVKPVIKNWTSPKNMRKHRTKWTTWINYNKKNK